MTKIVSYHKKALPSFGALSEDKSRDQDPLYIYTILSVNENVGDCAVYQGICRDAPYGTILHDELLERVQAGGQKIREAEAKEYFPEIERLRYRR
jgi:hypothetical protein